MQPKRTLNATQLTFLMVLPIAVPVGCGLLLSFFTPRIPEPTLPALVKLDSIWIGEDSPDRRLVPCISVKNPTVTDWKNLLVGLNEQFYCEMPKGVAAGQVFSVPLEAFVARNGSVHFPVGNRDIKLVTVFAQIESGARAVSEHSMPAIFTISRKSDEDSDDLGWVSGK